MSITLDPVADAARHYDRLAAAADKHATYVSELRAEMQRALLDDPQAKVRTWTGFPPRMAELPAAEVVDDGLVRPEDMHEILRTLGAAAKGEDVQLRAALLLSMWAARHARDVGEIAAAEGWIE